MVKVIVRLSCVSSTDSSMMADQPLGHPPVAPTGEAHAHAPLVHLVAAAGEDRLVEPHEVAHLVGGPLPVLGGEGVDREPLDAQLERALDRVEQRLLAGGVALGALEAPTAAPTGRCRPSRRPRGWGCGSDRCRGCAGGALTGAGLGDTVAPYRSPSTPSGTVPGCPSRRPPTAARTGRSAGHRGGSAHRRARPHGARRRHRGAARRARTGRARSRWPSPSGGPSPTSGHLIVQAGTGTGKSLAYLVPAIVSGAKVVIATATKALQDQLADKDLPVPRRAPRPAVRVRRAQGPVELPVPPARARGHHERRPGHARRARRTPRSPTRSGAWPTGPRPRPRPATGPSSTSSRRPGRGPRSASGPRVPRRRATARAASDCFAEQARTAAAEADVVVVNTHLYGLNLATGGGAAARARRGGHRRGPPARGRHLGHRSGSSSAAAASPTWPASPRRIVADAATLADLELAGDRHRRRAGRDVGPPAARRHRTSTWPTPSSRARGQRRAAAARALRDARRRPGRRRRPQAAGPARRPAPLIDDLDFVVDVPASRRGVGRGLGRLAGAQGRARSTWPRCCARRSGTHGHRRAHQRHDPRRAGRAARPRRPASSTSSTSAARSTTRTNALLYCAAHLPDPRHAAYEEQMHRRARGARSSPPAAARSPCSPATGPCTPPPTRCGRGCPWPILTQNDLPKPALVAALHRRRGRRACSPPWASGRASTCPARRCRWSPSTGCPFPRPDEPLLQARREQARADAFRVVDLPRAATLLAQGAGRLIRTIHRPRRRRRARPAPGQQRELPLGHRAAPCRRCAAPATAPRPRRCSAPSATADQ